MENEHLYIRFKTELQSTPLEIVTEWVNTPIGNWTPAYAAAWAGNVDGVKLLLSYGANIEIPTRTGSLPLAIAVERGKLEVVQTLLEAGANAHINTSNGHVFFSAIIHGHCSIIDLLIRYGVDPTILSSGSHYQPSLNHKDPFNFAIALALQGNTNAAMSLLALNKYNRGYWVFRCTTATAMSLRSILTQVTHSNDIIHFFSNFVDITDAAESESQYETLREILRFLPH